MSSKHEPDFLDGVFVTVIAVLLILVVFFVGYALGGSAADDELPQCEEDEYLYPRDYKGPGKNVTSDYRCVYVEEPGDG